MKLDLVAKQSFLSFSLFFLAVALPLAIFPWGDDVFDLAKVVVLWFCSLVLLLSFLYLLLKNGQLILVKTSVFLPAVTFLFALILSLFFSVNWRITLFGSALTRYETIFSWLSYLVLFYAATIFLSDYQKARVWTLLLIAAALVVSIYGLFQHFELDIFRFKLSELDRLRSFSTLGNPVFLGAFLVVTLPLSLSLLPQVKSQALKVVIVSFFLAGAVTLLFTYSRGAWLGTVIAFSVFIGLLLVKSSVFLEGRKVLILFLLVILVVLSLAILTEQATELSIRERIISATRFEASVAGRLSIWRSTLRLIAARPLVGWGLETLKSIIPPYREEFYVKLEGPNIIPDRPHNQLLYLAYATGSIGLLTYLWFCLTFFALCLRKILKSQPKMGGESLELANDQELTTNWLLLGIFSATLGYFIQEQFSFSLPAVTPIFYILIGLASSNFFSQQRLFLTIFFSPAKRLILTLVTVSLLIFGLNYLYRLTVADYLFRQANRLTPRGELHKALSLYKHSIKLNPWQSRYRFAAAELMKMAAVRSRNPQWAAEAAILYQKGLAHDPRDYDLYYGLGNVYYVSAFLGRGSYTLAEISYRQAIKLEPYFAEAYKGLGLTLFQEGKLRKSINQLKKAAKLRPQDSDIFYYIGSAYEKLGRFKSAYKYYQMALQLAPNNLAVRSSLSRVKKKAN
jgi:putative inorganic carbon (HCO3(-)) transporter